MKGERKGLKEEREEAVKEKETIGSLMVMRMNLERSGIHLSAGQAMKLIFLLIAAVMKIFAMDQRKSPGKNATVYIYVNSADATENGQMMVKLAERMKHWKVVNE